MKHSQERAMQMKSRSAVALSILVSLFAFAPCAVQAGFKVVDAPPPKPVAAAVPAAPKAGYSAFDGVDDASSDGPTSSTFGLSALTFTGTPSAPAELRRGFGRDVKLADALRQIAPEGWRGFGRADIAGTFDPTKVVNWTGGRSWTAALNALANDQGLAIEVDWTRKHLYVGKRTVLASVTKSSPAAVATPAPAWEAKTGSTVRATVEDWAKRAGWMVVWRTSDLDYRIIAPLNFDGSIVDATGRITRLYESAQRPLAVDIHPAQKVLVFSEKGVAAQ